MRQKGQVPNKRNKIGYSKCVLVPKSRITLQTKDELEGYGRQG